MKHFNLYKDANLNENIKQNYLLIIVFSLLLVIVIMAFAIIKSNETHRLSIPPRLEFGAIVDTSTIEPFEIYSFAGYIFQQLNFWQDGESDYVTNITNLSAFLTNAYKKYLLRDYKNLKQQGKLKGRSRTLQPIKMFKAIDVQKVNNYKWLVVIDFLLQEHIANNLLKSVPIRYYLNVIVQDVDPETNPWGFRLDTPVEKPKRLKQLKRG